MSPLLDFSVLFTVFMAGVLGSGHCFGMCGGIAAGLGSIPALGTDRHPGQRRARAISALLFNLGRMLSYAVLGLVSAWLLVQAGQALNVPKWGMILRLLTALMILMIGLQYLFNWHLLAGIERAGAKLWKLILPLAVRASSLPGGTGRLMLGLCWGLLPCGLVYSILLTASAAGSPLSGALVMFVFGLGTLPSMLGMSLSAPALAALLSDQWTRRFMGIAMILLAILSVTLISINPQSQHHHTSMLNAGGASPLTALSQETV